MNKIDSIVILLIFLNFFSAIKMHFLLKKYQLEIFEEIDTPYKKYLKTKREKLAVVGRLKALKRIKDKNTIFFYSYYLLYLITFFFIILRYI